MSVDTRAPATEAEVEGWLTSLRNWGRWGEADLRGTLNTITPDHVRSAARLVSSGETVSCALPIEYDRPAHGASGRPGEGAAWKTAPMHFMIKGGEGNIGPNAPMSYAGDAFLIAPHGSSITHLDTPSHILFRGTMFNGVPASTVSADGGAASGSVELAAAGVLTRGVLLDVCASRGEDPLADGEAIYPEDLEACESRAGVRVGPGDALLVRTGTRKRRPRGPLTGRPGFQAACLPWFRERDIAILGSDVTQDVHPHGYKIGSPIHLVGIWSIGLWLIDNCTLEALAAHCRARRRYEFLFAVAPLVLTKGTGSPLNPLAVF